MYLDITVISGTRAYGSNFAGIVALERFKFERSDKT